LTGCCRASVRGAGLRASSSSRWAPRLRTKSDGRQPLVVAGLLALSLLALGEAAPAAFPVEVSIEGHGATLQVSVDGQSHSLSSVIGPGWQGISLEQPGPLQREYQVDGSDTTSSADRQPLVIADLLGTPLYRLDSWLRDESSLSRWEHVQVLDLATGLAVPASSALPADFRVLADLRRPEAPARLWLVGASGDRREGLELDRDRRNARWLIQRDGGTDALPRWFFPEQPAPFAAELLWLIGRSAAAAYALVLTAVGLAALLPGSTVGVWRAGAGTWLGRLGSASDGTRLGRLPFVSGPTLHLTPGGGWAANLAVISRTATGALAANLAVLTRTTTDVVLAGWLLGAAAVGVLVYHQLPHILDAVSYTSQASLFVGGRIALDVGPLTQAVRGPFEALWQGRLFSQYPPGAPAAYALGQLVGLEWLVGPIACLALIAATRWTAGVLFGPACALVVLCLGALSPFLLFQAGSFLSHPIAGGLLAGALATFVAGERRGHLRWYAWSGVLLGAGFVTREAASVLFALPLGVRLLATRRWRPIAAMLACGLPFVVVYLVYNAALTGSPLLLPRTIFDPSDHFGFGDGIGFHTRHTLAAGLVNTDELLTLLQFDLFGWPPLFALGLLALPFLFGRSTTWDALAAGGFLVFVVAYTAYFYHGIALGPRYYFEAMPWLLLLAGRGVQMLAHLARSRLAAVVVVGLLSLNTVGFYLPRELDRRADFSALPFDRKVTLDFVRNGAFGPHLAGIQSPALVVTDDWWLYNAALAALNCPRLPACDVVFALATNPEDVNALHAQFPDRPVLRTVDRSGRIGLVPLEASAGVR
jgi:hypothetical protein